MFKNVPASRLLLYILCIGLLPVIFACIMVKNNYSTITSAQGRLESIRYVALAHEKKQSGNLAVITHYKENDHFYIDKNLESLSLLQEEIQALLQVTRTNNYAGDESIEKRLEQLQNDNQILFSEGPVQSNTLYQETIETLSKPVELDAFDLQRLLARIETIPSQDRIEEKRPQLIVLDFKLDRKEATPNHETFLLNLKLLKREFL